MKVNVFTCWSWVLSWWWLTLSCTDRAGLHDEPRDFCLLNSCVSHFVFVLGLLFWQWRFYIFELWLLGALWCKRNIFEKAAQLSVIVYDNKLNDSNDEKFVYFDRPHMHGIRVRDCEPSRIPKKWITHILKKFRKVRHLFRTYIKKKHTEVFLNASFYK